MNYSALLRSALVALLQNKMRSVLTVLGITIGIAAVICVVAIGKAGQARVEQQLNSLGENFVWIEGGGRAVNGVRTGTHDTKTLVYADAVAIKNQVALFKSVSPNVDDPVQVVNGNQTWHASYREVLPEFFEIKRWYVDQGAVFSQDDVDRAADVCVLDRTVRDQLFGVEELIGKVIGINDIPCKVVATLQPKGLSLSGQDQDDTVIVPFTTVQKKIKGITWLDDILCSAVSQDAVKIAGQEHFPGLHHNQYLSEGLARTNSQLPKVREWQARDRPTPNGGGHAEGLCGREKLRSSVLHSNRPTALAAEHPEAFATSDPCRSQAAKDGLSRISSLSHYVASQEFRPRGPHYDLAWPRGKDSDGHLFQAE